MYVFLQQAAAVIELILLLPIENWVSWNTLKGNSTFVRQVQLLEGP